MPRISKPPIPGRMSVRTIRQSLKGVAIGLANRKLTIGDRMKLIEHQAVLMNELRAVEKARRQAVQKPEVASPADGREHPLSEQNGKQKGAS
jgi:hypothetical protein